MRKKAIGTSVGERKRHSWTKNLLSRQI